MKTMDVNYKAGIVMMPTPENDGDGWEIDCFQSMMEEEGYETFADSYTEGFKSFEFARDISGMSENIQDYARQFGYALRVTG